MSSEGARHDLALVPDDCGKRLDRFLTERLGDRPGLSRTRLQNLIADGLVFLDGRPVTSSSLRLPATGDVAVSEPPLADAEPRPEAIPLAIVFEDSHLLVLDKPAGLVVHPAAGHADGTLVNALIAHCGDSLSGIGGVRRPGIVHRLDKDTSGLMVAAKSDAAHEGLTALFADHGRTRFLDRSYLAVVWGRPDRLSGILDQPLGRHPHQRDKMSIVPAARGRRAVTHWSVEATFEGASLIRCQLETGRTHQIRVHLTALGHPLIGDPVYGTGFRTKAARLAPAAAAAAAAFPRQALHATNLGFDHPVTGEPLRFTSAVPADLETLIAALGDAVA